ncbi:MAG: hypothetical protein ACI9B7_001337 [Oleispira sp.]
MNSAAVWPYNPRQLYVLLYWPVRDIYTGVMTKLSVAMSLDQSFKKAASNTFEYCLYHLLENDKIVFDFYARYKNKNVGRRLILLDFYYVLYLSN